MRKRIITLLFFSALPRLLQAQEAWLIPLDDPLYREAEELFINEGMVPPYEELPLAAEELKARLLSLSEGTEDAGQAIKIREFADDIALPFPFISPILELGLSAGLNTETGRFVPVPLYWGGEDEDPGDPFDPPYVSTDPDNGRKSYDYRPFYDANAIPSLLTVGFVAQFAGFSLLFEPDLRETNYGLMQDGDWISLPETFEQLDISNTPRTGMISYYSPNFELRFGRGKLHSGPGKYSTLSLSKTMPYFDHVRARFRHEGFSLSTTVVTLNPVISKMESEYLDYLYDTNTNPDPSGGANGKIYTDRIKNYINMNVVLRPWPWLSFSFTQTNLVGGRPLDLADFNPLLIIHNNFDDGSYSCPILLSSTIVPLRGVKIYGEFLLYDAAAGDELSAPNTTPGAVAFMGGLTLLSTPFFDAGPGRFRLDFEVTYVDPYTYGKYYDLRKFTSRFVYLDPGAGRYWVDYPLGFYLGPDCLDFHAALSYGVPGSWEAELSWQSTGRGEIDLYGYGDDTDYTSTNPIDGPAPTGTPEWSHSIRASFFFKPAPDVSVTLRYRLTFVNNRFDPAARANVAGDNAVFHYAGVSAVWKIF